MSQSDIGHTKGQHHRLSTRGKKPKIFTNNIPWKNHEIPGPDCQKRHTSFELCLKKTIPWNFPMTFLSQTKNNKIETIAQLRDNGGIRPAIISWGFTWHWGGSLGALDSHQKPQERLSLNTFIGAQKIHDFCLDGSCCKGRSSQTLRSCLVLFWISWESEAAFLEKRMQVKKRWFQILIP